MAAWLAVDFGFDFEPFFAGDFFFFFDFRAFCTFEWISATVKLHLPGTVAASSSSFFAAWYSSTEAKLTMELFARRCLMPRSAASAASVA